MSKISQISYTGIMQMGTIIDIMPQWRTTCLALYMSIAHFGEKHEINPLTASGLAHIPNPFGWGNRALGSVW